MKKDKFLGSMKFWNLLYFLLAIVFIIFGGSCLDNREDIPTYALGVLWSVCATLRFETFLECK